MDEEVKALKQRTQKICPKGAWGQLHFLPKKGRSGGGLSQKKEKTPKNTNFHIYFLGQGLLYNSDKNYVFSHGGKKTHFNVADMISQPILALEKF